MNTKSYIFLCIFVFFAVSVMGQNEPFSVRTVNTGYQLNSAWELTYGPDDSLWVTENSSYLVDRINPQTGGKTQLIDLSSKRDFSTSLSTWPQGGLMGLALHPSMYSEWPNPSKPWVYLAYVYHNVGCFTAKNGQDSGCFFKTKIVRYTYDRSTHSLSNPETIIQNLNGSTDHNSGRLTIGDIGGTPYLFYTIGDMGTGQFKNLNRTNRAQLRDTLEGKVLRFNLDAIGSASNPQNWIPNDNPFVDANGNSTAVWSYGHRNAQGLAFGSNGVLYSSEQQDMSDDEVNIIEEGRDYGWPLVSGYSDGNYDGYTLANMHVTSEEQDSIDYNLRAPIYTLYTTANPGPLYGTSNSTWPTVACSSLKVYENYIIPNWNRSLLIPSLKAGQVFRLKLSEDGKSVMGMTSIDTMNLYNKARLRDLCVSPDGLKIYVSCDMSSQNSAYKGKILEYTYTGPQSVLSIVPDSINTPAINTKIEVYPNPAKNILFVKSIKNQTSPLHYSIFDINGKVVLKGNSNINNFGINIQTLNPGMYVFKLYNAYYINICSTKIMVK
ncbi:MAG: PQQ-dependent sugar dehydrogenase [Bacteroidota bacterium]|nr:PQQ-dependent sugar dehydrogenase [Bacteroidota bacterium]